MKNNIVQKKERKIMVNKMYKVAVVLDNPSTQELFINQFTYLKKAILTEEALSKLEHYGNFPTLNEFHHSLLEISKFCVKNKIKGMIVACDYDYSDDETIWQNYVDIKHFRKMSSFTAIVNRNKNLNKLIKYLNTDIYLKELFGGKLELTFPNYLSNQSKFFEEPEVNVWTKLKNGNLRISYHYHNIWIEYTLSNTMNQFDICTEKELTLKTGVKISEYKKLNLRLMNMIEVINKELSTLEISVQE
jgi:hypothetical protein